MESEAGAEAAAITASPRAALASLRKGHASVVHLPGQWFIAATSRELGAKPLATTLFGTPVVLFRGAGGRAGALLDRCPHRNVPLSLGSVRDGALQCAYHGWCFATDGACTFIPSLTGSSSAKARNAHALPTIEQQGFVWVYTRASQGEAPAPTTVPHRFVHVGDARYTTVTQVVEAEGTLYSTIENALDVPHTAFLHRGLFRSESRGLSIEVKIARTHDRAEAEYVGEPRPPGVLARILSPSGGVVTHFDRFIMPSIAQVEYRIGTENHIVVDSVMTPVSDFRTRVYAVVSFRTRLPGWLIRPFVKPLALRVFRQDAFMLKKQTETIQAFGGEQFASTEIDVLGKHIWRLLKAGERGDAGAGDEVDTVSLVV